MQGVTATNGSTEAEAAEGPSAPGTPTQQQQPAADAAAAGPSGSGSDSVDSSAAAAVAAGAGAVKSHPLALPEDPFGAEVLVAELSDTSSLGKRGEAFFAAQALTILFVLFPPFKLAVRAARP